MRHTRPGVLATLLSLVAAGTSSAGVITVLPGDPSWTSSGNSGGGSSVIAATPLLDGNGAVQITGDRTRFNITNSNYGLLGNVNAFNFQWAVTQVGPTVPTGQAPALRLFTFDTSTNRQIQFIWEDGEQSSPVFVGNPAPVGTLGATYTGDFFGSANRVYPFTSGFGRGLFDGSGNLIAGSDSAQSIGSLITAGNLSNAVVFSFGVGVGSSVGNFQGFADGVTVGFKGGQPTTYDFQVAAAPVPEPATLAVFGLVGFAGLAYRRRKAAAGTPTLARPGPGRQPFRNVIRTTSAGFLRCGHSSPPGPGSSGRTCATGSWPRGTGFCASTTS